MDARSNDKHHYYHHHQRQQQHAGMAYHMQELDVCAVYPTCVLICWDPPRAVNESVDVDAVLQWSYLVEWISMHSVSKEPSTVTTTSCHAVLPVLYPNEIINVRVAARDSRSSEIVTLASTGRTIDSSVTIPMPWLHPDSMRCLCIFDALLLSSHGLQCVDAIPTGCNHVKATVHSVRMLESSFACILVKALYNVPPYPITSSVVYYYVVCSKALVKQRERLRHYSIRGVLEEEGASAVFCGVGEMGSSAALAAHLFISSVPEACNMLRSRVFCIAYGSPRRMFVEDSLVLASSSAFSGNFLYYTGLLFAADFFSGYTNVLFPTVSGAKDVVKSDGEQRFNAPLGVRCGPILDMKENIHYLHTRCSGVETIYEDECHERLDISEHLRILSRLLFPAGDAVLAPGIAAVTHSMEDGVIVSLSIIGTNLQYRPQVLCVSSRGGYPTTVSVNFVSPRKVTATFSLVELCGYFSRVRHKPLKRLRIDISLLTDTGYTTYERYAVEVPGDLAELLFLDSRQDLPHVWLFSQPLNLLHNAIFIEPLLATTTRKGSHRPSVTPQMSTELLGEIANVGEVASSYVSRKQSGSLLSFMANVAAKVSNSGSPAQAMTPMPIQVTTLREAAVFENALGEYVDGKKRTVSALQSKLAMWKQRLQQGLPWLDDTKYRNKLHSLLGVFEKTAPSRDIPLVWMELLLFTYLLRYLRNICGALHISHLSSLHSSMNFEAFYQHVHPLFLASMPVIENAAVEILLEAAALWTVCLIFHLRCSYLFTHIVAVTGCTGSGCSTMCSMITRLSMERNYRFRWSDRARNVVIRRAAEYELDDLKELLLLGLSATVVVVGEYADVKGMGYRATWKSIQRSLRNKKTQRVVTLLSKVDELVDQGAVAQKTPMNADEAVRLVCEEVVLAATAGEGGVDVPKNLIPVSFAPSVTFLKTCSFLHRCGVSVEEFTERLLAASVCQLQRILVLIGENNCS